MGQDDIHGLTAGYALNALDPVEEAEYEEHLGRCPACQQELTSLQGVASALAFGVDAPEPRPGLRARILAEARSERPSALPARRRFSFPATAAVAVAAAAAVVVLGIWASSLSSQLDDERQARRDLERATAILARPGAERIPISGASGSLVVAPTGEAALIVSGLGAAPEDKTYEAWVIEGGRPKPAGLFEAGDERTVVVLERSVREGAVVAVTLEREGGVDQPTGTPLFTAKSA